MVGESSRVPALRHGIRVLRHLARLGGPAPASAIAADLGLPRSTVYHLLAELAAEGLVVHLPEERRYGLGIGVYEMGAAYTRQAPLARLARPVLGRLVDAVRHSAHLAVLHGREVLYLLEERAPGGPSLVTEIGVRLPSHLTASGRAILAGLAPAQVRALFPDAAAFAERHDVGPRRLSELRTLLAEVRQRGYAFEDGEVTPGLASVAARATDHTGYPIAAVAVTFARESLPLESWPSLAERVSDATAELSRRLGGAT